MALIKSKGKKTNSNKKLTRKQKRKLERKEKKIKRNEYYANRNKPGKYVLNPNAGLEHKPPDEIKEKNIVKNPSKSSNKPLSIEEERIKEKREQKNLLKKGKNQRNKQLLQANLVEDRNIKKLEKQLKLNKRKSKSIPKSFAVDGLDYLLEVCDSENLKDVVAAEQDIQDVNDEFEEDFALMTGNSKSEKKTKKKQNKDDDIDDGDGLNEDFGSDFDDEAENSFEDESDEELQEELLEEESESEDEEIQENNKRKLLEKAKPKKKLKIEEEIESNEEGFDEDLDQSSNEDNDELEEGKQNQKTNSDGTWEDIYGRIRGPDGSIISNNERKYIPPAVRAKMEANSSEDVKRQEKLNRLRKQLKGLMNRLAESNMHSISTQIEDLYMKNSRNDMNETITNLLFESLISPIITPERLLMEHVLLVTILHANVGIEVGAYFLQTLIKKFDETFNSNPQVEDKTLDNIINITSQLYNFKLFDSKLIYEILTRLTDKFDEKSVECILHILRSIGFGLRKENPLALKELILNLQKKASEASDEMKDNSRVKFMLDILLAIKNNNVTKIPNYDTSYSEHLKKIMKGFVRDGNYVSQLNISLEDLLKADERGKWWVVGSAWTGNLAEKNDSKQESNAEALPERLLELARKQRMNTDVRRTIFGIIISAEDYLDAFEKLLKLGLKNQQEREIIHVILHCCLQEKTYNPYYSVLAQKFCDYDRKFQLIIKYSVWDKLKALGDHSTSQISNLAKLLTHLFLEKGLPVSTLKIIEFSDLDKISLRFIRQILLGIFLQGDVEALQGVFEKVSHSPKLKMFRESLRLFIHHFLLKNINTEVVDKQKRELLQTRAKVVDKILAAKDFHVKY